MKCCSRVVGHIGLHMESAALAWRVGPPDPRRALCAGNDCPCSRVLRLPESRACAGLPLRPHLLLCLRAEPVAPAPRSSARAQPSPHVRSIRAAPTVSVLNVAHSDALGWLSQATAPLSPIQPHLRDHFNRRAPGVRSDSRTPFLYQELGCP